MEDECDQIVKELQVVIDSEDTEEKLLNYTDNTIEKFKLELEQRRENIKKDIQALIEQESDELEKVDKKQALSADKDAEQLEKEIRTSQEHEATVNKQIDMVKADIFKQQQQVQSLVKEEEEVKKTKAKILPTLRNKLNLYQVTSNTRWQYDCEPHEIKGFVCNGKNLKPFSLESLKNSQFFIANYLWDMMEEENW